MPLPVYFGKKQSDVVSNGGIPVMKYVEQSGLANEAPEADAMEQRLAVDTEEDTGLDTNYVDSLTDRDANEADVIDQAIVVPRPEDDDYRPA